MNDIAELRKITGAPILKCREALLNTKTIDAAIDFLRASGISLANNKINRETSDGLVYTAENDTKVLIMTVLCETDFVARNNTFNDFCSKWAKAILNNEAVDTKEAISILGENIKIGETCIYDKNNTISTYIHNGGKLGVIVEGDNIPETVLKDIALQIAASSPVCIKRDEIPENIIERERALCFEMHSDKQPHVAEQILKGKLGKLYKDICLVDQPFVKNPEVSVNNVIKDGTILRFNVLRVKG